MAKLNRETEIKEIEERVKKLPPVGTVKLFEKSLLYLSIDDRYILELFGCLQDPKAQMPDYFSERTHYIGAHITIIYPEELSIKGDLQAKLEGEEGKNIHFSTHKLEAMHIVDKTYYFLQVISPELIAIRRRFGLSETLQFRKHAVTPHITIGYVFD